MRIGIIGALEVEINLLKKQLSNVEELIKNGFKFYQGTYQNKEIVLMECSIGKVNASIGTNLMIELFHPTYIINSGIAGALSSSLKPLDLVIGEKITYHDYPTYLLKKYFPYQEYFLSDNKLLQICKKLKEEISLGTVVTGDDFIDSYEKKQKILSNFDALCVEMEGCAIAHTCYIHKVSFLIIRCISDCADDNTNITYDNFEKLAANKSANFVLNLLEKL